MKANVKLYIELPGVTIREEKVPEDLRNLIPQAKAWCFLNERTIYEHLERTSLLSVLSFVDDCQRNLPALENFCFDTQHPTPIPHEVAMFQIMYNAFQAARVRI